MVLIIERTLVLIKPDGVERGLIGDIVKRFEQRGFKIIGLKMAFIDENFAKKHYTEDIAIRRGEHVRRYNVDFLTSGPVVAIVLEGVNAIENIRKIVGDTEPRKALPGTIRGDFSHVSYQYCDDKKCVVKNVIHASADKNDAERELKLWFKDSELYRYNSVHDKHIL